MTITIFIGRVFSAWAITDKNGNETKRYPNQNLMTPLEMLALVDAVESHLKTGITLPELQRYTGEKTDRESTTELRNARQILFSNINKNTT